MMVIQDKIMEIPAVSEKDSQPKGKWKPRIIGLVLIVACVAGIFLATTKAIAGVAALALMIVLMFLHVPIGIALAVPSLIGIYAISGIPATISVASSAPYSTASSWSLSVIPMFIFMGMLLTQSGLTSKIYTATDRWFGWFPGGLGVGTVAAGAGLASVMGSTITMTYTLARAGIPEMLRAGYDKRMAVGTVLAAGLPGALIPPSVLLVVYAGLASVPVGPQLVAGALPGILVAVVFGAVVVLVSLARPSLVGRNANQGPRSTWKLRWIALRDVWAFPVLIILLFGGMFSGLFTPTEAGAAAAFVALILCLWYTRKDQPLKKAAHATMSTVAATGAIFLIVLGAEMLTSMLSLTGLAPMLTSFITGMGLSKTGFLLILVLLYVVMGMFFETLSMMLLTVPILLPTLELMEISPIWFGVFVVLLGELAILTPPVGVLSYVVHGLVKDPAVNQGQHISLGNIFTAVFYIFPIILVIAVALILFPDVVTLLPDVMGG
jgi:C4-dicarboxylate transporter, DctM subunit